MYNSAFISKSESHLVASSATPALGVQVSPMEQFQGAPAGVYRIHNTGSVIVHLGVGGTDAEAQARAVAPTAGTPQRSVAIAPGAVELMSFPKDSYFSGFSSSGSTLFITAGEGQ